MGGTEQSGLGAPCMQAAPTKRDTADVSKPGPGCAWEFKKGQKGGSSILRLAGIRECTEQTRQLCELGTCRRNHAEITLRQTDYPASRAQREEV